MISVLFRFLFISAAFLQTTTDAGATKLEATCRKVSSLDPSTAAASYNFCITSLRVVAGSQSTDVRGLAVIAGRLTKAHYAHNLNFTQELLATRGKSDRERSALEACASGYFAGAETLRRGIGSLESGEPDRALLVLQEAWLRAAACDEDLKDFNGGGQELMTMKAESSEALGLLDLMIKLAILLML